MQDALKHKVAYAGPASVSVEPASAATLPAAPSPPRAHPGAREETRETRAGGRPPGIGAARTGLNAVTAWFQAKAYGLVVGTIGLALGLGLWQVLSVNKVNAFINFSNVPRPGLVFEAFVKQAFNPVFYVHIEVSVLRIAAGFLTAAVIGIALGTLMGRSKFGAALFAPYIEIMRPIPAVAWIPLAILMWPTDEASIAFITFLGALFPIVINTMQGVEQTPAVLVRAAKSLGASPLQIFWNVILPAALPSIVTGLAVGMGVSWFSLLAGEIISGQYGIGYFTWNAYSLVDYPDIIVGMLVTGALGTLSTALVRLAAHPFLKWQRRAR
jgi:NitT/TauT family transport system permease protein